MYSLTDMVKIQSADKRFNNMSGKVIEVYPAGTMDVEPVYMIQYDAPLGSNTKGMFKDSELTSA